MGKVIQEHYGGSVQSMNYRVLYFTIRHNLINVSLKGVFKNVQGHEPTYHIKSRFVARFERKAHFMQLC